MEEVEETIGWDPMSTDLLIPMKASVVGTLLRCNISVSLSRPMTRIGVTGYTICVDSAHF